MQAWSTVRTLSGRVSHTTGSSLLYKLYASDREKASAFLQEYAEISVRQSDEDPRKVVMALRWPKRSTRLSPRQQIEEAFTPGELQQALS